MWAIVSGRIVEVWEHAVVLPYSFLSLDQVDDAVLASALSRDFNDADDFTCGARIDRDRSFVEQGIAHESIEGLVGTTFALDFAVEVQATGLKIGVDMAPVLATFFAPVG